MESRKSIAIVLVALAGVAGGLWLFVGGSNTPLVEETKERSGVGESQPLSSGLDAEPPEGAFGAPPAPAPSPPQGRAGYRSDSLAAEGDTMDFRRPNLLARYGAADATAMDDLRIVDDVLNRFWLLYKNPDMLSVGSNEDIVRTLKGDNPDGIEFIPADSLYLDEHGRLMDRWGTPLFFHALSMTRIEIRSAGPDGRLFTDDDVLLGDDGEADPGV